jgi:Tfp pilus assembly protein PilO
MSIARLRQSSWIVTAPLTAAALVYLTCVWLPGNWRIETMWNQLAAMQRFVDQTAARQPAMADSVLELERAKLVATHWEKAAPRKRELSSLYQEINVLAQNAGTTLQQFDPQPGTAYEKVYAVPIIVDGSGTFAQIYEFLRRVEELPIISWATYIKLEKMSANAQDVRFQMELVVFANKS